MTLIALAITVAFVYSIAVSLGLPGMPFYWELATLVDIMLLGHWIEMASVAGASRALENLAIPLAAGVAYAWGILLSPAVSALLMSLSTVIVAINAVLLRRAKLA